MNAAKIAKAHNGYKAGSNWICRCPAHDDKAPSLSIRDGRDGKLLVRCFAGCDPLDVLAALREGKHTDTTDYKETTSEAGNDPTTAHRHRQALSLWRQTEPAPGTPVEAYMRFRGYTGPIPPTVRCYRHLPHQRTGLKLYAMVAAVALAPGREIMGIHRTYLKDDGSGKSPVDPNKMMLGSVKGGAVRLAPAAERMAVTEGIETGFSVQQATGIATWAALSAGGIENLILPALPLGADIVIAADNDVSGRGLAAAETAALRWMAEGRKVEIRMPETVGFDFNDVLCGGQL